MERNYTLSCFVFLNEVCHCASEDYDDNPCCLCYVLVWGNPTCLDTLNSELTVQHYVERLKTVKHFDDFCKFNHNCAPKDPKFLCCIPLETVCWTENGEDIPFDLSPLHRANYWSSPKTESYWSAPSKLLSKTLDYLESFGREQEIKQYESHDGMAYYFPATVCCFNQEMQLKNDVIDDFKDWSCICNYFVDMYMNSICQHVHISDESESESDCETLPSDLDDPIYITTDSGAEMSDDSDVYDFGF